MVLCALKAAGSPSRAATPTPARSAASPLGTKAATTARICAGASRARAQAARSSSREAQGTRAPSFADAEPRRSHTSSACAPFQGTGGGAGALGGRFAAESALLRSRTTSTSSVGRTRGNAHANGSLEAARIADLAGGDGVRQRLRRGDDGARPGSRLGVARAHARAVGGRRVERSGQHAAIRLDEASARRDQIRERALGGEHLEDLARGHREQEVHARRHPLRLEQRGRREQIAEGHASVAAEQHLRRRVFR